MINARDYIMAEFYSFKDRFIIPFLGNESDKKSFVITGVTDPVINKHNQFYNIRVDIHGKIVFIRYSTIIELSIPSLQIEHGRVKLSKIFEKLFNLVNYIAFNSSDKDFVDWLRNSDARMIIKYNYYIVDDQVYGYSEVGIYRKNQILFSVGVMNNGKNFYPAYFKLTQPFLRLKPKTQESIITHLLKSLFSVKNISDFRIKGFRSEVEENIMVSQIIGDMVKRVLPVIIRAGKRAFQDPTKPIGCIYTYENGKISKKLINVTLIM